MSKKMLRKIKAVIDFELIHNCHLMLDEEELVDNI